MRRSSRNIHTCDNKASQSMRRIKSEQTEKGCYVMDFENRNTTEEPERLQEPISEPHSDSQQPGGNPPVSDSSPHRQEPLEQRLHAGNPSYTTYQEWLEMERKRTAKQERHKERTEKKKNRNHKPILIVGIDCRSLCPVCGAVSRSAARCGTAKLRQQKRRSIPICRA